MATLSAPDSDLLQSARAIEPRITALRRAIHAEPELGLHTPLTRDKVRAELADLPIDWREGGSTTGLVGTLKGAREGPSVLLRGDMDALPMEEKTGLPFASTIAGRMHACGHDTHTAMLAGAARILADRQADIAGDVRFMFQPGEEGFHGARHMLEDGLLDPLPDAAFALHIMPNARHGTFAARPGAMMASADQLEIVVEGAGGHASMPHDTRDPVPVAAAIVTALQALVTRRFNAAHAIVITITQMEAGSAHNIIPDHVRLAGTIRTLDDADRRVVHEAIGQVARSIAAAHDQQACVTITPGFPVTMNDPRAVALAQAVAQQAGGPDAFETMPAASMGAEDFSYVLQKVPGAMIFMGVAEEGADWQACCGIHSPRMLVDETALPTGAAFLAACALHYGEHGWSVGES